MQLRCASSGWAAQLAGLRRSAARCRLLHHADGPLSVARGDLADAAQRHDAGFLLRVQLSLVGQQLLLQKCIRSRKSARTFANGAAARRQLRLGG